MHKPYEAIDKTTIGIYEFARATGLSLKHIYNEIRLGRIPAKQVGTRKVWRINKETLDKFLGRRKQV